LEVTTKVQAQLKRDVDRIKTYKKLFTSDTSPAALFNIKGVRFFRISNLTVQAPHAFLIGKDTSMCVWDFRARTSEADKGEEINVLYVVGFGTIIREDDAWQEFDSLIRLTLKDWSSAA
jgi:hypothetical protein